jgi:8-oxo-dGTP pyrophosphatase MutT (NUDIX family)
MRARAIIISDGGRLLLGLNQDGNYMLPGGGIKEGEHPVDALLREVKEETGIEKYSSLEYLWSYLDNFVFIFVPEDNMLQVTNVNDPCNEFQYLEWFDLEALPPNLDSYAEDIIYRFIRFEILHSGQQEEPMKKNNQLAISATSFIQAGHIDVIVDGEKAFQLDDDTIWLTLPRLAQERSKGKKIEFRQVLDDGTVVDQRPIPMPNKDDMEDKEKAVAWVKKNPTACCLSDEDKEFYAKTVLLDLSSELLNPGVQILKLADTFSNALLFDGKDEFWITNQCQPVWRSSYANRYASYEEMTEIWNIKFPKHSITLDWLKDSFKKMFEVNKDGDSKDRKDQLAKELANKKKVQTKRKSKKVKK